MMFGEDGPELDKWFPRPFRMRDDRVGQQFKGIYGDYDAQDEAALKAKL